VLTEVFYEVISDTNIGYGGGYPAVADDNTLLGDNITTVDLAGR